MTSFQLNALMQDSSFPMIEALFCESSNVNGDTVSAYAVTKVNILSEGERLDSLMKLVGLSLSNAEIVSGLSYASSDKWTVADDIIYKQKKYNHNQKFKVIWLENKWLRSEYHGYAGYEIHRLRGIVLRYPEELSNVV